MISKNQVLAIFLAFIALFVVAGRYGDSLGTGDPSTGAIMVIDYPHHEIHGGSSFSALYSDVTANADNHRSAIGFTTPDTTKWFHLVGSVAASSPAEVFVLEAPTIDDDDGTQKVAYNRNRNSATTSTVLSLESSATAGSVTTFDETELVAATLSGGTELVYMIIQEGKGGNAIGGAARGQQEWMLKQNTKYLFIVQNIGGNANAHTIQLDWYEHTDR